MGVGASAQRGPPGADGKDGAPGKDAVVDYIQLVNKTVTNDAFKNQVKALLGDQTFKSILTDYMNANIGTFRGPKGETEFKNLTAEEQSQIITKLINNNMTTFAVQLMANNSFKDAILEMLRSNPVNFKGPQGVQGPQGVGIKDARYDTATGNLMFIRTDNNTIGSFMVRGAEGPPGPQGPIGAPGPKGDTGAMGTMGPIGLTGPAGTIDTPANTTWLQGKTMWCADGSCVVPSGNSIKNKLIRLGTSPDDQPGMAAQGEGVFIKSSVAPGTPSTLIKIGDANYPESGNPEMVFTGFQGGNAYSSGIRSGKGMDLQFITNGEFRATMNSNGLNVNNGLTVKDDLILGEGKEKNKWILHTPDTDAKSLYIAFRNKDLAEGKGDWDWAKQVQIKNTGEVLVNGNLNINKGQTNELALALRSSGPGWGSGMQLINTAQGGKTYGIYSGADGGLHFADTADRLLIRNDGKLIVNGRDILAELDKAVKVDDSGKVNIPTGKLKINNWDLDATDGMLRFKLGNDQIFVLHDDSWHQSSAWVRGSFYSNRYNKFL